ncbi:hypothetical protein [Stieleria mannarensis]|uniref:hypothetical protein n=1 Tax=Stieleria mannarensis TaxID=2755585 RepID=UPI001601603F|nr:hypothetical protein [Rhodopirellula sp. JC639]
MNFRRRIAESVLRQTLLWGVFVGFCGGIFATPWAALLPDDHHPTSLVVAALDQPALPSESISRVGGEGSQPLQPTATAFLNADRVGSGAVERCGRVLGPSNTPPAPFSLVACGVRLQI